MENRDQQLSNLRPLIPTLIEQGVTSSSEQFQNGTLRPILKFQNNLLLQIFRNYTVQRKNTFQKLSPPEKLRYIESSIQKDLKFRNLLIGIVVGQFTQEELKSYFENEGELRKRLINLVIERLKSQVVELKLDN